MELPAGQNTDLTHWRVKGYPTKDSSHHSNARSSRFYRFKSCQSTVKALTPMNYRGLKMPDICLALNSTVVITFNDTFSNRTNVFQYLNATQCQWLDAV